MKIKLLLLAALLASVLPAAAQRRDAAGDARFDGARPRQGQVQGRASAGAGARSTSSGWGLDAVWAEARRLRDEAQRLGARMGIPGVTPPRRPVGGRIPVPAPRPSAPRYSARVQRIIDQGRTLRVFDGWRGRRQPRAAPMDGDRITIHHTGDDSRATDRNTSIETMRQIQREHLSRGYDDIGYNFIINTAGFLIEGRGDGVIGAHVEGHNTGNIGISLMGNFELVLPGQAQADMAIRLSAFLINRHDLRTDNDAFMTGHRQNPGASTACPGRNVFSRLPEWRRDAREVARYFRERPGFLALAVYQ